MPLYLFYTMVQKSQKWPKTQIKGGPALRLPSLLWHCGLSGKHEEASGHFAIWCMQRRLYHKRELLCMLMVY